MHVAEVGPSHDSPLVSPLVLPGRTSRPGGEAEGGGSPARVARDRGGRVTMRPVLQVGGANMEVSVGAADASTHTELAGVVAGRWTNIFL